ncbi:MAG: hypothetical protein LLF90_03855 [Methanomicrobiaceae archaeon]|nr:hypothetical protein [Methanomicrobiaceae archaeon]
MERDLKTGIIIGAAICLPGIVYMPPVAAGPVTAAVVCGGLGALTLLGVVTRDRPAAVGLGMTALALLGGYALLAGILSGPAALGVGLLALAAVAVLAVRVLPARRPQRAVSP